MLTFPWREPTKPPLPLNSNRRQPQPSHNQETPRNTAGGKQPQERERERATAPHHTINGGSGRPLNQLVWCGVLCFVGFGGCSVCAPPEHKPKTKPTRQQKQKGNHTQHETEPQQAQTKTEAQTTNTQTQQQNTQHTDKPS